MVNWIFILLIAGAYLLGSIPAAYIVARLSKGIDIRKQGSGNVGASNVASSTTKLLAVPVFLFDIAKGYFAAWIAGFAGFDVYFQVLVGIFAVIGHNWPVFLNFKGGRGIATSFGVVLAVSPLLGLIVFVMSYSLAPFKQLAVGVLIAFISLPLFSWFLPDPLDMEDGNQAAFGFITLFILVLFRRLIQPRAEISRNLSLPELVINRLVFDRDIRNRETWLQRNL